MLRKTLLSYIAGFVDGEGCITIIKHNTHSKAGGKSPHYQSAVAIAMTDPRVLEIIQKNFGGSLRKRDKSASWKKKHWKQVYHWSIVAQQAIPFIKAIRPYLILKAEEADIAIELQQHIIDRRKDMYGGKRGRNPLSDEVLAHRESLRQKIRNLKRLEH